MRTTFITLTMMIAITAMAQDEMRMGKLILMPSKDKIR